MKYQNTDITWTRRQMMTTVTLAPLALCYSNRALANPFAGLVLRALGRFAVTVAANVVSSLISDYIKSKYLPTRNIDAIRRHHDEMWESGFRHVQHKVYELTDPYHEKKLLFYGVEHEKGQNGCMVVSSSEGISCLSGPTIVGLGYAADLLHHTGSITPKSHIGLALLPRSPYDESGGFSEDYRSSYLSEGFSIDIEYKRHSYDAIADIGHGDFHIRMRRTAILNKNADLFLDEHVAI